MNQPDHGGFTASSVTRLGLTWLLKAVTACLGAVLVHQGFLTLDGLQRIATLDREHTFVNLDSTGDEHVAHLSAQDSSLDAMKDLLEYARHGKTVFSYWEYPDETFDDGSLSYAATTDRSFFEAYGLRVMDGTLDDFATADEDQPRPVVAGSRVAELHPLGSRWSSVDLDSGVPVEYETVAVLEGNQTIPSLTDLGRGLSADERYFIPVNIEALDSFPTLDMAIGSLVIHSEDSRFPDSVSQRSRDLGLFDMQFAAVDELVDEYFEQARYSSSVRAALILGAGGVAVGLTIVEFLATVRRHGPSLSARYIAGASPRRIYWRLLLRTWSITASVSPVVLIYSILTLQAVAPVPVVLVVLAAVDAACLVSLRHRLTPHRMIRTSDH